MTVGRRPAIRSQSLATVAGRQPKSAPASATLSAAARTGCVAILRRTRPETRSVTTPGCASPVQAASAAEVVRLAPYPSRDGPATPDDDVASSVVIASRQ